MRERGTLLASVVLLGGLAAGSYWLAEQARLGDVPTRKAGHEVDYTAQDIALTRMDETGRAQYTLDARKMVHYADDDTGELTQPRVVGSKAGRPEMRLRADLGRTTADADEVRLYGNVALNRAAWRGAPPLVATSEFARVWPDRERFETDKTIKVVRGGSSIVAGSMQYDNATQVAKLGSGNGERVRQILAPRDPHGRAHTPQNTPTSP